MIFIGVILLIVAAGCFFAARGQTNQLRSMSATDTFTANMLQDLYKQVVPTLGGEALSQQCEVEGVIECDAPLTSPLSKTMCVAYTRSVTREFEAEVTSTDQQGKKETRIERQSETVESEDRRTNFHVRDDSGRVLVNPEEAELDLVETANRYEDAAPTGARPRTLGHRYREETLAVGTRVYILGCAVDGHGQPMIARNPRDHKQKFMISRRGERELASAAERAARNFTYAAAGSGALGIVLLLIGLVAG